MNAVELKNHLFYFIDAFSEEEEVRSLISKEVKYGYGQGIEDDLEYLNNFIASNPDKKELGWFIATEMNRDFDDPTGEQHFQWLVSARDLIQSVLEETKQVQHQP